MTATVTAAPAAPYKFKGEFTITAPRTYATKENARKAVEKAGIEHVRHFYMTNDEGRWFPVFVGQNALDHGVHFRFNVVG